MAEKLVYVNPYTNGEIITFDDGSKILDRVQLDYQPSGDKDINHTVVDGDTLWNLADTFYGDDKWWYIIYEANDIYNPFILDTGMDLIIPDIDIIRTLR